MSHKRKQPRRDGDPHVYRQPRIESEPSADHLTFRWRTNYMDYEGPFGWGSLSVHDFCRFVVAPLHQLETMAWGQVLGMKHNHTLTWSSVSSIAIHRLEECADNLPVSAEEIELLSLGLRGRERIVGVRDRRCFYLLWWDSFHQISPSNR